MLEIIRSILERKVWDALLLEKFKNFFKKEDTQIKFLTITTLIISKKPGNTGISRDIRTEFTTDLLLSD